MTVQTPTQIRRRLLTRYALRASTSGATVTRVRDHLAAMAAEIDAAERECLVALLSYVHVDPALLPGGATTALEAIARTIRDRISVLGELAKSGGAIEAPELPPHIRPYPDPPEEPLALKVGMRQAAEMHTTIWLDALAPEDLEAMAAWLRKRRTGATI